MILLATLLGVLVLGVSWRRPTWGAIGIIAVLPTYQLRFTVFGLPSTVLEVVVLASLLGAAMHWLRYRDTWPTLNRGLRWAMGVWLVIGLFATWIAADHYHALGIFRAYILEPVLLVPLLLGVARDARARTILLHVFSVQLMLFALVALGQKFGWIASLAPWNAESPARFTSVFPYPNAAALYIAPCAALLAGSWLAFRGRIARWKTHLWIISAFAGILVCILAVSRGAILGLGFAAIIAAAWSARRWLWWGVCALAIITMLIVPTTRQNITRIITTQDTSSDVRTVLWQGTWRMLRAHPFEGAGLGAFPKVYNRYRLPQHVELLQYPHNLLLNVWSELGLAGLIFSIAALFWLSTKLFHLLRNRQPWAVGAFLAWVVLLVHGLVDVPFFKNDLAILTVGLACLAAFVPAADNKIPPA